MKVLFIWTGVPSYMVACWRELVKKPEVRVKLLLEISSGEEAAAEAMLQGLDFELHIKDKPVDKEAARASIAAFAPDLLVIVGWRAKISRFVALDTAFESISKLLAFDLIFEWKLKKFLAPLVLRGYLKRFAGAFVPGDRTTFYSKFLGFSSSHIHRGLFSIDTLKFAAAFEERKGRANYPRRFIFAGRYAPEKRLDILVQAYQLYSSKVSQPWDLDCYGSGPKGGLLEGVAGIHDCGAAAAAEMTGIYARHGAFVLTSEFDPWPLVVAESTAAGLPVVCTEACGSHADLVRSHYNGIVCGTNDAASIAAGMLWVHENEEHLLEIGGRGMALVAPYSKEQWVANFLQICKKFSLASRLTSCEKSRW